MNASSVFSKPYTKCFILETRKSSARLCKWPRVGYDKSRFAAPELSKFLKRTMPIEVYLLKNERKRAQCMRHISLRKYQALEERLVTKVLIRKRRWIGLLKSTYARDAMIFTQSFTIMPLFGIQTFRQRSTYEKCSSQALLATIRLKRPA